MCIKSTKTMTKTEQLDGCFCLVNYTDSIIVRRLVSLHATYTTNLGETLRTIGWDTSVHMAGQFRLCGLDSSVLRHPIWTLRYWCQNVWTLWTHLNSVEVTQLNSTQLNSTENYGRRCLTPLSPHRNYILS